MKNTWTWALALALAGCNAPTADSPKAATAPAAATVTAADLDQARAFLAHVYATYYPDVPLEDVLPDDQVYAPALLAAMEANSQANDGEVGYLDADPLCQCQDTAQDLRQLAFTLTPLDGGRLRATARLADPVAPLALDLTLSRQKGQWRIADIASPAEPSLLKALERDTEMARQRP
jgi:hypothetical protein